MASTAEKCNHLFRYSYGPADSEGNQKRISSCSRCGEVLQIHLVNNRGRKL